MVKTRAQILRARKDLERTFKKNTAMGKVEEAITEIKQRLDDLEK